MKASAAGSDTVVNIGSATPGADGTTVINTPTVTFANAVTEVGMPQANLTVQLLGLGGAAADSINRLSVNTPAVLLNNAGAGIEATVNKAAPVNDAAFAFKTGFSARALIGLLGSDDFSFKVSPDGSTYYDAILIDRTSGRVELPEAGNSAFRIQRAGAAGVGQAGTLRPDTRRPPLARCHAIERARLLAAAAYRAGADRQLDAFDRYHDHHRGDTNHLGRHRLDSDAHRHLAREQHAPLAPHLGGGDGLGGRPAQQLRLLARQRRRTWRLDLRRPDSRSPRCRQPAWRSSASMARPGHSPPR